MKKITRLTGALLLLAHTYMAEGQSCPQWPADCPADDYANINRVDDSVQRLQNPVVPQEIAMENRLRALTNALISQLAAREHWEAVELDESLASGFRAPDESVLAYDKRPPHWLNITYEIIVNNDSLLQWRSWLEEFSQRRLEAAKAMMQRQQGETENGRFEKEKQSHTVLYREASVVVVQFCFNMPVAETRGKQSDITARVPAARLALHFTNEPDMLDAINPFAKSRNIDLVLLGNWLAKPDGNNYYRSSFSTDRNAAGMQGAKKIKCDQLQTAAVYLSGNKAAMQKCLDAISWNAINSIIVK